MALFSAQIITLFPDMFPGPLAHSLAGKALEQGLWRLDTISLRDFGLTKHKMVDDAPYGGGAGMVMRPDVIDAALDYAYEKKPDHQLIYLSPRGETLTQDKVKTFSKGKGLTFLCGRFEGVDQRVLDHWHEKRGLAEISIGDYILSGGEVAALVVLDSVVRLIPGVMGNQTSEESESFSTDLLEYPHYTRPGEWKNKIVPEVLRSGDHQKIAAWRQEQAERITCMRRPDLWERYIKNR